MPVTITKAHTEPVYIHHQSSPARFRVPLPLFPPLCRRLQRCRTSHRFPPAKGLGANFYPSMNLSRTGGKEGARGGKCCRSSLSH